MEEGDISARAISSSNNNSSNKKRMQSIMFLSTSAAEPPSQSSNIPANMEMMQTSPSAGPLPAMQDQMIFRKRFADLFIKNEQVEEEEHLICSFDCLLSGLHSSTGTWSGKIFGTARHLCFFGNPSSGSSNNPSSIDGKAVRIVIKWLDVLSVSADKSSSGFRSVNDTIKLVTLTKKYFFNQFSIPPSLPSPLITNNSGLTVTAVTIGSGGGDGTIGRMPRAEYVCLKLKSLWDSSLLIHSSQKDQSKHLPLQIVTEDMNKSNNEDRSPAVPKSNENLSMSMFAGIDEQSSPQELDMLKTSINMRSNDAVYEDKIGLQTIERRHQDSKVVMHELADGDGRRSGRTPMRPASKLGRQVQPLSAVSSTTSLQQSKTEAKGADKVCGSSSPSMPMESVLWTVFILMVFVTVYTQNRLSNVEMASVNKATEYGFLVESFRVILETL